MTIIGKERFFWEPTSARIRKLTSSLIHTSGDIGEIVDKLESLNEDEALCIDSCIEGNPIIPIQHYRDAHGGPYPVEGKAGPASIHFLRHGTSAQLRQFDQRGELNEDLAAFIKDADKIPIEIPDWLTPEAFFLISECSQAYNEAFKNGVPLSGYVFFPIDGKDKRPRKIFLTELLEADQLDNYSEQSQTVRTKFGTIFGDVREARRTGAKVDVSYSPSRSKKRGTKYPRAYRFRFFSVPVAFNEDRFAIAYSISSTLERHPEKENLRLEFGDNYVPFVAQEIQAYRAFIRHFYHLSDGEISRFNVGNIDMTRARFVPIETCQFRIPNQEMIDFYLKMVHQTLVAYSDGNKTRYRKLAKGEQEALLSEKVRKHKNDIWGTFFIQGEKMQNHQWLKYAS